MECYSTLKKEGNSIISDNMNEPGGHFAKWNKPITKTNIIWSNLYMKSKGCPTHRTRE